MSIRLRHLSVLFAVLIMISGTAFASLPQWTTSGRLLKLCESIDFKFTLPSGATAGDLVIYPQYLERANPGKAFKAGGDLAWVKRLASEKIPLNFNNGQASLTYKPKKPGNYLATWQVGDEVFYRYFAVIEDDSIVLLFSTFWGLESEP